MYALNLVALLGLYVMFCVCQTSRLVVNVIEVRSIDDFTLVCNIPSSTNLTRWTFLSGSTGNLLMSYQNGRCTVSPSDSFLSDSRYSYTCNSTVYQVTIYHSTSGGLNNHILACRDAVQPDNTGSTWMIKTVSDGDQCNCNSTITYSIREVTEGENVRISWSTFRNSEYVNWYIFGISNTATMRVQNGQCTTQGTTFLDNASKYIYTCRLSRLSDPFLLLDLYEVTILNIQRNEHNDIYMCTGYGLAYTISGSQWIIKVQAPVTSVTLTPSIFPVNVIENTAVEFTCTTSTARPAASVNWYRHPNGNWQNVSQITDNIITTTDYIDFSVTTSILRFVPTRQDNDIKIYCRANNSVNASPVSSNQRLLNVLYVPDTPTELKQIQSQTTTSSIHIEWKPGFNGGPNQTFNIKYKNSLDSSWTYFNVIDGGEETMNLSLTGLAENTQYDIVIFASNINGNSSESPVLIASTKGTSNTQTNIVPLVGSIVGGVTGCVILVVIIIVIIRRYTFCKVCSKTASNKKSDKTKSSPEEQAYNNTGRLEDITNENNDATAYDELGSDDYANNSAEDSITNNVSSVSNNEMVNLNNIELTPSRPNRTTHNI